DSESLPVVLVEAVSFDVNGVKQAFWVQLLQKTAVDALEAEWMFGDARREGIEDSRRPARRCHVAVSNAVVLFEAATVRGHGARFVTALDHAARAGAPAARRAAAGPAARRPAPARHQGLARSRAAGARFTGARAHRATAPRNAR